MNRVVQGKTWPSNRVYVGLVAYGVLAPAMIALLLSIKVVWYAEGIGKYGWPLALLLGVTGFIAFVAAAFHRSLALRLLALFGCGFYLFVLMAQML